jgi:purine nucleoside phosphorylase
MSVGVVFGPDLADAACRESVAGAGGSRVRIPGESPAVRASGVREMFTAGVDTLLLVERAVPVRPDWARSGALFALVADHINLTGDNPLVGPNADEWGPRFPDLTDAWDPGLRRAIRERAARSGITLQEGVVGGVVGTARTAAELDMLRMIGADMASEGFVHEAIVARHAGRRVAGIALLAIGTGLPGEARALAKLLHEAVAALAATPEVARQ